MRYLLAAEADKIQDFIFRSSRLREVVEERQQLDRRHREILTMRNILNLPYEEIAQTLRINVGTVKSRIARARESLRQRMGDDFK